MWEENTLQVIKSLLGSTRSRRLSSKESSFFTHLVVHPTCKASLGHVPGCGVFTRQLHEPLCRACGEGTAVGSEQIEEGGMRGVDPADERMLQVSIYIYICVYVCL